ncbi:MAG TPA: urease accessory protein UreD, partial [Rhodopila sp.]|nr:urease accessory protein UreD [Rhodopila sp.]
TSGWMDIVTLNTSGGIAGGDRLDLRFSVARGARATIAAQAAERFYRLVPGGEASVVRASVDVAAGGAAEWLPQETILFDECGLDRRLEVSVAGDARFLGLETLVFGRAAMGETVATASVRDLIRVRRDGVLLLHDAVRLEGAVDAALRRAAVAGGCRAVGTVVYVGPDAEARLDAVRERLGAEAAASAWNGMLIARIVAADGAALRRSATGILSALRDGRPLPRVWMC